MKSRRPRNPTAQEVLDMVPPERRAEVIARNPHLFGAEATTTATTSSSPAGAMGALVGAATAASTATTTSSPAPPPLRRGRQPNKTEQRWLDELARDPTVRRFTFEGVTLRLADGVRYTPDVFIEYTDGGLGLDEVKGPFVRDLARAKFQVARDLYPGFRWRWCQWAGGRWRVGEEAGKARLTEQSGDGTGRPAAPGIGVSA